MSAIDPIQNERLVTLIREDEWMMHVLRVSRSVGCRDWSLGAGFVRSKVWDHLHGYSARTSMSDIDFVFFDRDRLEPEYEQALTRELTQRAPELEWEPVNQATIHTYNKMAPYQSLEDALSCWTETATAIGVFIDDNDAIRFVAPYGFDDLFNLIVRPVLKIPGAREIYLHRVVTKRWAERWPKLKILPAVVA